jgi:hypothetical protein
MEDFTNYLLLAIVYIPPIIFWYYMTKDNKHTVRTKGGRYTSYTNLLYLVFIFGAIALYMGLCSLILEGLFL